MYKNKAIVKRIGETAMKQCLGNLGNKVMKTKKMPTLVNYLLMMYFVPLKQG